MEQVSVVTGKVFSFSPEDLLKDSVELPKLDMELLPASIRGWIVDCIERIQGQESFAVAAVLCGASSIIGRQRALFPKEWDRGWCVVPNLWGAVIGSPSQKKSPIIKMMMEPVYYLQKQANQKHEEELFVYNQREDEYRLQKKVWEREYMNQYRKQSEASAMDYSDLLDRPVAPVQPCKEVYQISDPTIERLLQIVQETPRGTLILRDELYGWLKSLEQDGKQKNDRSYYLELWTGDAYISDDRMGRDGINIEGGCASVFGGIQPDSIVSYVSDTLAGKNDGLLQRFQLLVYPDPLTAYTHTDRAEDEAAKESYMSAMLALSELGFANDNHEPITLRFTSDAQKVFTRWFIENERRTRGECRGTILEEVLGKYNSFVPSLALIFQLLCDPSSMQVDVVAVENAIKLAQYFEAHVHKLFHRRKTKLDLAVRMLAKRIINKALTDGFTSREVKRKEWHGLDAQMVDDALLELESAGWVASTNIGKTKPKIVYNINPEIFSMYGK